MKFSHLQIDLIIWFHDSNYFLYETYNLYFFYNIISKMIENKHL